MAQTIHPHQHHAEESHQHLVQRRLRYVVVGLVALLALIIATALNAV